MNVSAKIGIELTATDAERRVCPKPIEPSKWNGRVFAGE